MATWFPATVIVEGAAVSATRRTPLLLATTGGSLKVSAGGCRTLSLAGTVSQSVAAIVTSSIADDRMRTVHVVGMGA